MSHYGDRISSLAIIALSISETPRADELPSMANVEPRLIPALVSRPNARSINGLTNYLEAQRSQSKDNMVTPYAASLQQTALRSKPSISLPPMDAAAAMQPVANCAGKDAKPLNSDPKSERLQRLRDVEVGDHRHVFFLDRDVPFF